MNNSKNFIGNLLVVFIFSLLFTSCKQDSLQEEVAITPTNNYAPTARQGVNQFRDIAHFEAYYKQLNQLYDLDDNQFYQILQANADVFTIYAKTMDQEISRIEDYYHPFLADPIMMSIVNEHFEFRIADVLLTVVTNSLILTADANVLETQQLTRALKKGDAFNHLSIPRGTYLVTDEKMEDMLGPWGTTPYNFSIDEHIQGLRGVCDLIEKSELSVKDYAGRFLLYNTRNYYSWTNFTYEEAKCVSLRMINNELKAFIANLRVQVWAERTNKSGEGCILLPFESEEKECDNCSQQRARVNTFGKKGHHTVRGNFDLKWTSSTGQNVGINGYHLLTYF